MFNTPYHRVADRAADRVGHRVANRVAHRVAHQFVHRVCNQPNVPISTLNTYVKPKKSKTNQTSEKIDYLLV